MPTYTAPLKDYQFLINHFLELDKHADVEGFNEAKDLVEPLLAESAKLCEEVLFPLNTVGDKQGLKYKDGTVTTPDGFKDAYKQYVEGGWPTLTWPAEFGGQGMPEFLNMPMLEMVCSSNLSFGLTPGLTHGAISLLIKHGTEEMKRTYLPKMIAGIWSGVMCLTEPVAGTDLGIIKTRAEPNADGTYSVTGTKIFISAGEQDQTENIIHLVLAKLPGAPAGAKGISLFLCPKFMVNADGSLGARNQFSCASIEHKMGIRCLAHFCIRMPVGNIRLARGPQRQRPRCLDEAFHREQHAPHIRVNRNRVGDFLRKLGPRQRAALQALFRVGERVLVCGFRNP